MPDSATNKPKYSQERAGACSPCGAQNARFSEINVHYFASEKCDLGFCEAPAKKCTLISESTHGVASTRLRATLLSGSVLAMAMMLCLLLIMPHGRAFAEDASSSSGQSADSSPATVQGNEERPTAKRAQEAVGACIAGLFAGWGVEDPTTFYGSDALLIDDGSCVWLAFDVYRAGATDGSKAFLERLENYVTESYAGDQHGLDAYSPTTWARTAIVSGAMGANPRKFGTNAAGQPADLLSDGLYNWSYTENLSNQGSNALVYALQAIDALQVAVPADAKYSAAYVLESLLDCQAEDGSFALSSGSRTGSVDLTGMALAALAPYRDMPEVSDAVDAAIEYLSAQQSPDGGFSAEGEATSESCAMVIIGLSACGIDATIDKRFVKERGTPLDALLKFQKTDGTFAHLVGDLSEEKVKDLPTEQALRALVAFAELQQGGDGNVYTSDIELDVWRAPDDEGLAEPGAAGDGAFLDTGWVPYLISIFVGAGIALVVVAAIWFVRKIRRKARR